MESSENIKAAMLCGTPVKYRNNIYERIISYSYNVIRERDTGLIHAYYSLTLKHFHKDRITVALPEEIEILPASV